MPYRNEEKVIQWGGWGTILILAASAAFSLWVFSKVLPWLFG